ncbi:prolipoprotein diacylglyceryl transferase [Cardinium endosymbiont of Culicoides punctatus]|uniref:prolipoprotein diacylglyceryl transferase n=1 Tax=Cardinium endosymbiont of Culicoides punctatus TaxID=2304601 RepID=UPI00105900F4|nr:prolipoprotein diacylglyceryl transferase [Cardinium endosymbiont of Culicoides punctatus]TDG95579.1 Prolipoprotein diacylglyceryl transferase [Cardinium endosymbiont of Culicoides punctatus]
MLATIVWDKSPEIFQLGSFTLRWYNLLFVASFILGSPIWHHMFTKAGKDVREAEVVKIYLIFGVLFGARLGHVIFYEWNYYKNHLSEIFLPCVFSPEFKIVGFSGLASHGAAIGIILAIFLYVKRMKVSIFPFRIRFESRRPPGEFLWLLDHLVILVALGGAFIRIGNFMNSEIIGKPTNANYGVIFIRSFKDEFSKNYSSMVENLEICKAPTDRTLATKGGLQPIQLVISFKKTMEDEIVIKQFLEVSLKNMLVRSSHGEEPMVYETYGTPLSYTLSKVETYGEYQAVVNTLGIPRHPAQLYESFSCFLIFVLLLVWWYKKGQTLCPGRILGGFMLMVFALRFFYEFYKENQTPFEDHMLLNMGQLLSLPLIIAGLFLVLRPRPKVKNDPNIS